MLVIRHLSLVMLWISEVERSLRFSLLNLLERPLHPLNVLVVESDVVSLQELTLAVTMHVLQLNLSRPKLDWEAVLDSQPFLQLLSSLHPNLLHSVK